MVKSELGYKYYWVVSDYLQRVVWYIVFKIDVDQVYVVGCVVVEFVVVGKNVVMFIIVCKDIKKYVWIIGEVLFSKVVNVEKKMLCKFISKDGFGIIFFGCVYLELLIGGEFYLFYKNGLFQFVQFKLVVVFKKFNDVFQVQCRLDQLKV